jgi:hypothetical protein
MWYMYYAPHMDYWHTRRLLSVLHNTIWHNSQFFFRYARNFGTSSHLRLIYASPILKISRDLNFSRNANLEAAAPILVLRSENSRFFTESRVFLCLSYARKISRIAFLKISSLNVLHRLTYVTRH